MADSSARLRQIADEFKAISQTPAHKWQCHTELIAGALIREAISLGAFAEPEHAATRAQIAFFGATLPELKADEVAFMTVVERFAADPSLTPGTSKMGDLYQLVAQAIDATAEALLADAKGQSEEDGGAAGQDAKPAAGNQLSQACQGTDYVRLIRIFVSSPGDVQAERDILEKAVAQINRTDGHELGVMLQTFRWEKDVIPQIGPPAQKVVNEQTPDCGIYVGIMSARFGTRTEDFGSGTEEEFQDAVKRWGARGKPWILLYFDKNPPPPKTSEDTSQFRKVVRFRKKIQKMGITGTYESVDKGENSLFFQALTHLRKVAAIIGKDPGSPSCPV